MGVHRSAYIHPDAQIHESCEIGVNVVIDGPVRMGPGCWLGPSVVVMGDTVIGAGCSLHAHAVIGDIPQDHKYKGGKTYCRIGENCVIREGVTIHRACIEGATTTVGNRCYLMTNCHVAHDCVLDDDVILVSGALLGGHVQVGAKAIISGNVGVHQFVRIGELAMVGAVSFVGQDIPPFLMTDHCGSVVGLNNIGMRRAGMSLAQVNDVKALYKLLFRSNLSLGVAKDVGHIMATTDAGQRFIQFFREASRRGVGSNTGRLRVAS